MKFKCIITLLLFFITTNIYSQNMKEGFTFLETGKYQQAETFFKVILKSFPADKTARLCYGRAVGLNGNSNKSVILFTNLLNDFPTDFEVKLNYAESLLWDKKYTKAEKYYEKLLKENDKSFPALLGYANTLSNLKKYDNAIIYVNKALVVMPNNQNALVSKKYMRLGLADNEISAQNYIKAEKILEENFNDFKNDKETLLNLANLYLISNQIDKAKKTYKVIGENSKNKLTSLNGISLAYHLNGDNKEALKTSKKAIVLLSETKDIAIKNKTKERFVQALIWNKKYSLAEKEINSLVLKDKNPENWILSLRATLNIYKSNFKKSIADYNLILEKDSASFDGNLGKANALKALGYFVEAYKSAKKTLSFYKNQKDATNFIKKLDNSFTPFIDNKISYSFDNGNNEAYSYKANTEFSLSTRFKLLGNYNFRTTKNTVSNIKATSNNFLIGISYDLLNNLTFKGNVGITATNTETKNYTQLLTDLSLNIKTF